MTVAVLPGDGIGPEVAAEAIRVLDALAIEHAEHSFGVVGGFGSCGLWQLAHGFSGLWATGLICGKPLGRDGL